MSDASETRRGYVPGRHKIEDYGNGGFRFAEMSHRGSILASPAGVRAMPLEKPEDIDDAAIDAVLAEGGVDLLLVGSGAELRPLKRALREKLKGAGVGCEIMATGTAVRTYNMLLDENRRVAALLIAI